MRSPRTALPRPTDRLPLGRSGLAVSPFCLGMTNAPESVSAAFEHGINFFFLSADMHWPLYEANRRGLADLLRRPGVRDDIVVAVAAYVTQPVFCSYPFREVLDALPGLERIDLLVAGGAYGYELDRRWPVYRRHRDERYAGARAAGVSFHDRAAAAAAIGGGELDLALIRYNSLHAGARRDLLPHLPDQRDTLVYNFKSMHGALAVEAARARLGAYWVPAPRDHYRFVLTRPEIDGVLFGPAGPAELADMVAGLADGPLSPEEEEHVMLITELVKPT